MLMKALLKFNASYNLILEDDVKPAKNAFAKCIEFAESQGNFGLLALYSSYRKTWKIGAKRLYNGIYGTPAWLFSREATQKVSNMLLSKPWWYPVDLQIPPFVVGTLRMAIYERNPNLFQHISKSSTYTGKVPQYVCLFAIIIYNNYCAHLIHNIYVMIKGCKLCVTMHHCKHVMIEFRPS